MERRRVRSSFGAIVGFHVYQGLVRHQERYLRLHAGVTIVHPLLHVELLDKRPSGPFFYLKAECQDSGTASTLVVNVPTFRRRPPQRQRPLHLRPSPELL